MLRVIVEFRDQRASMVVESIPGIVDAVSHLHENPEQAAEMGRNGFAILENNRGALRRLLELVDPLISGD